MASRLARGLTPARLRLILAVLFVALAVPSAVLIVQTQRQLKWEAFHQYRTLADELGLRIDVELQRLIAAEEGRGFGDYAFIVVAGDPGTSTLVERSPLSRFPVQAELPGVIGYFQVDAQGAFSTPLLPDGQADPQRWGIDAAEWAQRNALRDQLFDVLSRNRLANQDRGNVLQDAKLAAAGYRTDRSAGTASTTRTESTSTGSAGTPAAARDTGTKDKTAALVQDQQLTAHAQQSGPFADVEAQRQVQAQVAFDQLNAPAEQSARSPRNELGRIDDLRLSKTYQQRSEDVDAQAQAPAYEQNLKANVQTRAARKERSAVVDTIEREGALAETAAAPPLRIFESELGPFEFSLLDASHAVLFRKVWRDGRRTIQGALVDPRALLQGAVVKPFRETALAEVSDLLIAHHDNVVEVARGGPVVATGSAAAPVEGELLHQLRLSAPFGDYQLLWNVDRLPPGPGARVVAWAGAVLFAVLVLGLVVLYRLGLRQLTLARQQRDFVSAVSHELKTPLTSIRMYAEMLREGWVAPAKQREYYDYIHDESERLSRLIANVLQLARMERNELRLELKPVGAAALMDMLRSKVASQIARAGFEASYAIDPDCADAELAVDADAFVQIMINLVDNALKFSARAPRRAVDVAVRRHGGYTLVWSVRDYGPGVEKAQMRKIFALFYRPGSELTRLTLGTGIGLALVRQLARAMGGEADVVNRDPGAEFRVVLPRRTP
jgi:signal transduction histidine kinase